MLVPSTEEMSISVIPREEHLNSVIRVFYSRWIILIQLKLIPARGWVTGGKSIATGAVEVGTNVIIGPESAGLHFGDFSFEAYESENLQTRSPQLKLPVRRIGVQKFNVLKASNDLSRIWTLGIEANTLSLFLQ